MWSGLIKIIYYIQGQFLWNQSLVVHFCIMSEIPWLFPVESSYNCEEINFTYFYRGLYFQGHLYRFAVYEIKSWDVAFTSSSKLVFAFVNDCSVI